MLMYATEVYEISYEKILQYDFIGFRWGPEYFITYDDKNKLHGLGRITY